MPVAHGVAVVLGQRAVADDEQLHILEQAAARPEAVALVAVDLVEGLADVHATALEFDVHHRQAVDQHGHIEAGGTRACRAHCWCLVLIDHLQSVVVDVGLVDQVDVLGVPSSRFKTWMWSSWMRAVFSRMPSLAPAMQRGEEPLPFSIGKADPLSLSNWRRKLASRSASEAMVR
jgi:hypothetical protein